jgi:hypothetical protein
MKKAMLVFLLVIAAVYAVLDPPNVHFGNFPLPQSVETK